MQAWPDDKVSNFHSEIASFFDLCGDLSLRILRVMALGLQLEVLCITFTMSHQIQFWIWLFFFIKLSVIVTNFVSLSWYAIYILFTCVTDCYNYFLLRIQVFLQALTRLWQVQKTVLLYDCCTIQASQRTWSLNQGRFAVESILTMAQSLCSFRMICPDWRLT